MTGVIEFDHLYVSTACQHREHGYCRSETGSLGNKTPAECKFCGAPCLCPCHPPRWTHA